MSNYKTPGVYRGDCQVSSIRSSSGNRYPSVHWSTQKATRTVAGDLKWYSYPYQFYVGV